jgi:dCTP deaminase
MSLLSYLELINLVKNGIIDSPIEQVNPSSIDVRIDEWIMVVDDNKVDGNSFIDLSEKEILPMRKVNICDGYDIEPGEFILASTIEWFDLSNRNDLAGGFKLKSSVARSGLEHLYAAHIDAGWSGNLTLELINLSPVHLTIRPKMKIGQVLFTTHAPIPDSAMYNAAGRGQYCDQKGVTESKGIK